MIRRLLTPLVLGAVGMLVILIAWHLWEDHRLLHALIDLERQRQAAAARPPAVPAPPSAPDGR